MGVLRFAQNDEVHRFIQRGTVILSEAKDLLPSWFWFILLGLLVLFVLGRMLWRLTRPTHPAEDRAGKFFTHIFSDEIPFNAKSRTFEGQTPHWRDSMRAAGGSMNEARVRSIFFGHGTFLGDDPLGLVRALQLGYPKFFARHEEAVRRIVRASTNRWVNDTANFSPVYVNLFGLSLGTGVLCQEFVWSSENHHMGRLRGMQVLAKNLARTIQAEKIGKDERILLMGHSHAGQLFALLTLCLEALPSEHPMLRVAFDEKERAELRDALKIIAPVWLDIVTFGTPLRYPWGIKHKRVRILHIVNHRGETPFATDLKGIFNTVSGDYIHRFGVMGSDLLATHREDREKNRQLDPLLGMGIAPRDWLREMRIGRRVSSYGTTLLVDYGDSGRLIPNSATTALGHAIYTRFSVMLYNVQLIVEQFYKPNN